MRHDRAWRDRALTEDIDGVVSLYQRLPSIEPVARAAGGALFALGDGELVVHELAGEQTGGPPNEDHFALTVDDLAAACAQAMAEDLTLLVEPRNYPWGRSAYLRDPDGRLVELAQA